MWLTAFAAMRLTNQSVKKHPVTVDGVLSIFLCVLQVALRNGDFPSQLPCSINPFPRDDLNVVQRLRHGLAVSYAPGQLRNLRDKDVVCLAPIKDSFVFNSKHHRLNSARPSAFILASFLRKYHEFFRFPISLVSLVHSAANHCWISAAPMSTA